MYQTTPTADDQSVDKQHNRRDPHNLPNGAAKKLLISLLSRSACGIKQEKERSNKIFR